MKVSASCSWLSDNGQSNRARETYHRNNTHVVIVVIRIHTITYIHYTLLNTTMKYIHVQNTVALATCSMQMKITYTLGPQAAIQSRHYSDK